MSVSCNNFPTATSVAQITTDELSTTSSAVVTTEPPTVTTSTTVIACSPPVGGSVTSTCIPVTSTTVITSPGSVHTTFVPVTITVPITTTSATTLWGSSCTTITTPNPDPGVSTPPTPTPTPITTESSSTQPNGSVVVQTIVVTSTNPGGPSQTNLQNSDQNGNSTNIAPIVGGAVGGFFGLIGIVLLVWFIIKRRRRWDDIWETDEDIAAALGGNKPRRDMLESEVEPKPYEYGLVGKAQPPPSSPPQSPPFGPSRPEHGRTPSLAPLLTPMSAASQTLGSGATISSRPSTGGSIQPLVVNSQQPQSQMQQGPNQPQRPEMGRAASAMSHAHSTSNTSITSPPVSLLNWTGNPGPSFNDSVQGVFAGTSYGAMAAGPSNAGPPTPGPSNANAYPPSPPSVISQLERVGSPMSFVEQRRLHVANAAPMSPQSAEFDPYAMDNAIAAASAAATTVIPASQPQLDGKGRLTMPAGGSNTPIVHLDGGRLQDALNIGRAPTAGPSPPAYSA